MRREEGAGMTVHYEADGPPVVITINRLNRLDVFTDRRQTPKVRAGDDRAGRQPASEPKGRTS
jgi:hypothetical protein